MTTTDRPPFTFTVTSLRFIEAIEPETSGYLNRSDVEPFTQVDPEGVFVLTVHNQGEYGLFEIPYIRTSTMYQSDDLLALCISYHGTETFGPKRNRHVSKGQFWRFYVKTDQGWLRQNWQQLSDVHQASAHAAWFACEMDWLRPPGKMRGDRAKPQKTVYTTYKAVEVREGRYYSLYQPTEEYVIGEEKKQAARAGHKGGYFSYPDVGRAQKWAVMYPERIIAILECEVRGKIIRYANSKWAATYLKPMRELERFSCKKLS